MLSMASVHSTGSVRSYSTRRFEREKEQKLARQRTRELLTVSARSTDQLLAEQSLVSKVPFNVQLFIKNLLLSQLTFWNALPDNTKFIEKCARFWAAVRDLVRQGMWG